ncbi:MAG TPA: flavodoxin family protein [Burkholderiaceae bacterium]
MTPVRKGQFTGKIKRDEFQLRFHANYKQAEYDGVRDALARIEEVAWNNYVQGRKPAATEKAGPGHADPDYDLSTEWKAAHDRLLQAEQRQKDPATRSRVLLICSSHRNDGTCPGEMSKTFRLTQLAREVCEQAGMEADLLDLSRLTSDYDRHIHPCKGCVSTAMPLCHWPCSCYPNYAERQTNDWMNEIYEQWVSAHAIIFLTPVYWYETPSALKLMIDRLVCADGGNPDPTSTAGKDAEKAKQLELDGWPYPKHLAGRVYGVFVHGDVAGIEGTRRALSDWMDWMGLLDAGALSRVDRYIGYYESYAESHAALDADSAVQEEVRNVARAVVKAVELMREGKLPNPGDGIKAARPK